MAKTARTAVKKPARKTAKKPVKKPAKKATRKGRGGGFGGPTAFVGGFWPHADVHGSGTQLMLRGWLRGGGAMPTQVHARHFPPSGGPNDHPNIPVSNWRFNFTLPGGNLTAAGDHNVVVFLNANWSGEITGT